SLLQFTSFLTSFVSTRPATPYIYTLSLHDALPISTRAVCEMRLAEVSDQLDNYQLHPGVIDSCFQLLGLSLPHEEIARMQLVVIDRKSTRLNSSHVAISYAVFCLKKKIDRIVVDSV